MSSYDLSVAFDVVNVKLPLKRLEIIGFSKDIIGLIRAWVCERHCYVSLNGNYVNVSLWMK